MLNLLLMPSNVAIQLSSREAEICLRVRQVREDLKWSQRDFASEMGVSLDTLKGCEYGRAAVRYFFARSLGRTFDINQRWLATGQRPRKPYFEPAPEFELAIPNEELFSHVFDRLLEEFIEGEIQALARVVGCAEEDIDQLPDIPFTDPFGGTGDKSNLTALRRVALLMVTHWLPAIPPKLRHEYVERLDASAAKFRREHEREIRDYYDVRRIEAAEEEEKQRIVKFVETRLGYLGSQESSVDEPTLKRYKTAVLDPDEIMPTLMEEVRRLTTERGSRAALARDVLHIEPQRLNEYLTGKRSPGGKISLLLRDWVREQEAASQKKDLGTASTAPRRSTQSDQESTHEKTESKKASHKGTKRSTAANGGKRGSR